MAEPGASPDPDARRAQMARVLHAPAFRRSARSSELLRYLVEAQAEGREVTAYAIAFDLFERDASFDPGSDPIVRVQMGRLRRALDDYASGPGRDDPWRIVLEPRTYAPEWRRPASAEPPPDPDPRPVPPAKAPRATSRRRRAVLAGVTFAAVLAAAVAALVLRPSPTLASDEPPVLAVLPFSTENVDPESRFLGTGLQHEVGADLWRFETARVLVVSDPDALERLSGRLVYTETGAQVDYLLRGSVLGGQEAVTFGVELERARDARLLWRSAPNAVETPLNYATVVATVAARIANEIGRPLGPLGRDALRRIDARTEREAGSYGCYLVIARWARQGANADYQPARDCLASLRARGIETSANLSAEAWMDALSTDPSRRYFRPGEDDARRRQALEKAARAIQLDPGDDVAHARYGLVQWLDGDEEGALSSLRRALRLNPGLPQHGAELGLYLCLAGRCDEGIGHAEAALADDPDPAPWYYAAPTIKALLDGRPVAAMTGARFLLGASDDNDCAYYVAAAGLAGRDVRSRRCRAVIARNRAALGDPLGGSRTWVRDPALLAVLQEGIERSGL